MRRSRNECWLLPDGRINAGGSGYSAARARQSDLLQRSLGPSIVLETHFPSAVGQVQADANQLEMSLLNLAVNARDAMPQGGSIVIAAEDMNVSADGHTRLPAGRYVCLSVTDTGEGMDDETLV